MQPATFVWVFNGIGGYFPGGVFAELAAAEAWIAANRLTGILTAYPLNEGCLDWAIRSNCVNMKPEKLAARRNDPQFVGSFSTAGQEHYHYENGRRT